MTARIWLVFLCFLAGCGTLITKIPIPFGDRPPPLNSFPGVQCDWEGIQEGYYILLLDLPFSLAGDLLFILLQPGFWVLYPWLRLIYE
jgi:uncharacterized protein YceK